jgi:hypothetical protein
MFIAPKKAKTEEKPAVRAAVKEEPGDEKKETE